MGTDGAEQMATLVLFAIFIAVLPSLSKTAITLAVWFIGSQSILSYATAGIAKAISPTWRAGVGISLIMGSEAHGQPFISVVLARFPVFAKLLCWLVVLFECTFPLVLLAPEAITISMLLIGFVFHLGCAISMGLNAFLFAFPGTYVCVAYIAQQMSPNW